MSSSCSFSLDIKTSLSLTSLRQSASCWFSWPATGFFSGFTSLSSLFCFVITTSRSSTSFRNLAICFSLFTKNDFVLATKTFQFAFSRSRMFTRSRNVASCFFCPLIDSWNMFNYWIIVLNLACIFATCANVSSFSFFNLKLSSLWYLSLALL